MKGFKHMIYFCLAAAMLIYAVPQVQIGEGLTLSSVFGIIWICFALLVIAAHLHALLRVDEETKKELARIKAVRRWQMQQRVSGKQKMMVVKK